MHALMTDRQSTSPILPMSAEAREEIVPTEISLHKKSRLLAVAFSDGSRFELPCEYLRVFSKAADVSRMPEPVVGKEHVNIERVEPQGHYAVRLFFDDGYDSGIYSWGTLRDLGLNHERNWATYLERLEAMGYRRREPFAGPRRIKVLFFAFLANLLGTEAEEVMVPEAVADVRGVLELLRMKGGHWEKQLQDEAVRVTVNRQFAEPFTKLEAGDELAIVPKSPNPR
jgi:DUF971 family protein/molybdopterin converting factor small subunit